jgi:MFS family permease
MLVDNKTKGKALPLVTALHLSALQ